MKQLKIALKMLLIFTLLTGFIYPLLITFISQIVFYDKSNGSLITLNHNVIGSALIGQNFKKEEYFHPRPSTVNYDPIKPASGSNLGPTNKDLKSIVEERLTHFSSPPPTELVYASGSGLDPNISLEAALFQMNRIAKARNIQNLEDLAEFIKLLAQKEQGEYVNVLLINLELNQRFPPK